MDIHAYHLYIYSSHGNKSGQLVFLAFLLSSIFSSSDLVSFSQSLTQDAKRENFEDKWSYEENQIK